MDEENPTSDEEFLPADPEYRRLHHGVRHDPESVWNDLRDYLCRARAPGNPDNRDLIEDLMFWHADAFVDRLDSLVRECPKTRESVAWAVVEGVFGTGVDRFHNLQERLNNELEVERKARRKRISVAVIAALGYVVGALAVRRSK